MGQDARAAGAAGEQAAARLDSAWSSAGAGVQRTTSLIGNATSALINAKTVILGIAAAGAGGGLAKALFGSNADLEASKTAFNVLVGDAGKARSLIAEIRKFAAETPFAESDLINASKSLLRLTGSNAEQNLKLLRQAGQLAAISPGKTIQEAAEAILDAETQEFERLKEFGIKLSVEDIRKAKKRGETLSQASLRGVEEGLTKLTGGRDVVAALSQTFTGRLSTLTDRVGETVRRAGEPAFEVLSKGLSEVDKQFSALEADPKFVEEFKAVQDALAFGAKSAVDLVKALPQGVGFARALKDEVVSFASANEGLLRAGALVYGANKLSGGGLLPGAAGAARRAVFGAGGGPLASLASAAGGGDGAAIPVRVVNVGDFGGGLGGAAGAAGKAGFLTRNTGGPGTLSTFSAFGSSIASKGALATLGGAGTAAGGGILALIAGGAALQLEVIRRTDRIVQRFEDKEKAEREALVAQRQAIKERDRLEAEATTARRALTRGTRQFFDTALLPGQDPEVRRQSLALGLKAAQDALGGSGARLKDGKLSTDQEAALAATNASVRSLGIRFDLGGKGRTVGERLRVVSGEGALSERDTALVAQFRQLNELRQRDPAAFQSQVAGSPEFKRLNKEADRIREQIGRGNLLGTELERTARAVQIGSINVTLPPGTDANTAQVFAAELGVELKKTLALLDQQGG